MYLSIDFRRNPYEKGRTIHPTQPGRRNVARQGRRSHDRPSPFAEQLVARLYLSSDAYSLVTILGKRARQLLAAGFASAYKLSRIAAGHKSERKFSWPLRPFLNTRPDSSFKMLFNSLTFLVFFVVVYALFWATPGRSGRKWLLLVASYVFYAAWSPPYVFVLAFSTSVDWWMARLIGRSENSTRRRGLLVLSLLTNLGLLGYFKYGNFLLDNFASLLSWFGFQYHKPGLGIVLPIGISFYTFASLSYTIDVYRREIKGDTRFTDYALFVSFFPHLVAGPIVRAAYLIPQIVSPRQPTRNQIGWGIALLVLGLFSKTVMADAILAPVVDRFYDAPAKVGAVDSWIAVLSFSGQIYYDFSGYSLCAIGLAMCFGYWFPDNFRYPFGARGFSDFWRRWHISLSSWLRDYLYISLGGNRFGDQRTFAALLSTMLIGGLWHGASWMFVLWGGMHGVLLICERLFRRFTPTNLRASPHLNFPLQLFTFAAITLLWIPFRAAAPDQAAIVAAGLVRTSLPITVDNQDVLACAVMLVTVGWHIAMRNLRLEDVIAKLGPVLQTGVLALCLIGLFLCSGGDQRAFLYFQF